MLDIYSIADEDAPWQDPREECHIGSFSLDEWKALSGLWPMVNDVDVRFSAKSFFEDTRVMSAVVAVVLEQVEEFIQSSLPSEPSARIAAEKAGRKFGQVLEKSVIQGNGIIAFCD